MPFVSFLDLQAVQTFNSTGFGRLVPSAYSSVLAMPRIDVEFDLIGVEIVEFLPTTTSVWVNIFSFSGFSCITCWMLLT